MTSSLDEFPLLTSVRVVCRECLSLRELSHINVHINEFLPVGSIKNACNRGSLRLMKLVAARDTKAHWGGLAEIAAKLGHLDILQWLSEFHADRSFWTNALRYAATSGHLPVVKWLHTHRQDKCSTDAMDKAASRGHLEVVKWLHNNRTEGCTKKAMNWAAQNGHLDVVKWLHEYTGKGCAIYIMDGVANLDVLKWLHENLRGGWLCSTEAIDKAAELGRLDVVKWLHENRTEGYTTHAIELAARNGHLDVVKWLFHHDGDKRRYYCQAGACEFCRLRPFLYGGQYESLYDFTVKMARMNGHQHVVEWVVVEWVESLGYPKTANKSWL